MIPKIKFREMTLKENVDVIKWAYFEGCEQLSVHDYTIQYFPELASIDVNATEEEICSKIEEVVTKGYNQYKERIKSETERYNEIWSQYNDKYFEQLSKYLEVNWPSHIDTIEGKVGLMPVFPRYLDEFAFSLNTGLQNQELIETAAHETLHFLWFEKWKQLHPETQRREFDSPYLAWQYSEMVTDPVLNNKPFSELFKDIFIERGYDSFYELQDENGLVMDNLRNIYSKNIPIEEKINTGFEYVKKVLEPEKSKKR